jgi:hypothetical protein
MDIKTMRGVQGGGKWRAVTIRQYGLCETNYGVRTLAAALASVNSH